MAEITDGVEWMRVYWVLGPYPQRGDARFRNEVSNPPTSGWGLAYFLRSLDPPEEPKPGKKPKPRRVTIFCPYSFQSFQVSEEAAEIAYAKEPRDDYRSLFMAKLLADKWADFQRRGVAVDYDTAALLLKRLGLPIPTIIVSADGTADTTSRGGKPAAEKLIKPVKKEGKRGKFLEWFLADEGRPRPIREAMVEFNVTRSNALSYLFMLHKDHGIGYALVGDAASIQLPEGTTEETVWEADAAA